MEGGRADGGGERGGWTCVRGMERGALGKWSLLGGGRGEGEVVGWGMGAARLRDARWMEVMIRRKVGASMARA